MNGKTHLIIPDSHAHPDFSNERYSVLGQLICDIKPDVVVDIGDWFDMPSLCSYDRGKKSFEGRRYKKDIEAGLDAQERMFTPIRKQKKKLPRFVRTLGNHENRISRCVEMDAVLEGTIGLSDLQSREFGWEEVPFMDPISVDGIKYCHYFTSGVKGLPISGERPGYMLVHKKLESCTQGHAHTFDYYVRSAGDRKLHGLVCGEFVDYEMDYAGQANQLWRSGVVIKRGVENGDYDMEWISMKRLKEAYSV